MNGNRSYTCILRFYQPYVRVSFVTEIISIVIFIVFKARATRERPITDRGYTVGDSYARKARAIFERIPADCGDTVGDSHARKAVAIRERRIADRCYSFGNYNLSYKLSVKIKILCVTKRICVRTIKAYITPSGKVGDIYCVKASANRERLIAD